MDFFVRKYSVIYPKLIQSSIPSIISWSEEVYHATTENKTNFYFAFLFLSGVGLAYGFMRKSKMGKK